MIISHNQEFVSALCEFLVYSRIIIDSLIGPEIWQVEAGHLTHKGKAATVEDAFLDKKGSGAATPVRSRLQSPAGSTPGSTAATPAGSGVEDGGEAKVLLKKKKKLTRNQIKARDERRKLRKLNWLTHGGPKPEDTDSD